MIQTTVTIEGMMCGMCEAHINDTIRKLYPKAKKVSASHTKGEAQFLTDAAIDEKALRSAIDATGYTFVSCKSVPYEKHGFFHRSKS